MYLSKYILKLIAKYPVLGHVVCPFVRLQNLIKGYWDVLIPIVLLLVLLATLLNPVNAHTVVDSIDHNGDYVVYDETCYVDVGEHVTINLCSLNIKNCEPNPNGDGSLRCFDE